MLLQLRHLRPSEGVALETSELPQRHLEQHSRFLPAWSAKPGIELSPECRLQILKRRMQA